MNYLRNRVVTTLVVYLLHKQFDTNIFVRKYQKYQKNKKKRFLYSNSSKHSTKMTETDRCVAAWLRRSPKSSSISQYSDG